MHDAVTPSSTARVQRARMMAMTAPTLDGETRLLLAAAEATQAVVGPARGPELACAVVDHGSSAISAAATVRELHVAVNDAVVSGGLAGTIGGGAIVRIVWRLAFDLWGGPER